MGIGGSEGHLTSAHTLHQRYMEIWSRPNQAWSTTFLKDMIPIIFQANLARSTREVLYSTREFIGKEETMVNSRC